MAFDFAMLATFIYGYSGVTVTFEMCNLRHSYSLLSSYVMSDLVTVCSKCTFYQRDGFVLTLPCLLPRLQMFYFCCLFCCGRQYEFFTYGTRTGAYPGPVYRDTLISCMLKAPQCQSIIGVKECCLPKESQHFFAVA